MKENKKKQKSKTKQKKQEEEEDKSNTLLGKTKKTTKQLRPSKRTK